MPISNEHTSIKKRQTYHDVLRGNLETVKKRRKKITLFKNSYEHTLKFHFYFPIKR